MAHAKELHAVRAHASASALYSPAPSGRRTSRHRRIAASAGRPLPGMGTISGSTFTNQREPLYHISSTIVRGSRRRPLLSMRSAHGSRSHFRAIRGHIVSSYPPPKTPPKRDPRNTLPEAASHAILRAQPFKG